MLDFIELKYEFDDLCEWAGPIARINHHFAQPRPCLVIPLRLLPQHLFLFVDFSLVLGVTGLFIDEIIIR